MQIYSVARNVLGALGPRVKVPVLDCKKEKTKNTTTTGHHPDSGACLCNCCIKEVSRCSKSNSVRSRS